MTVELKLLLGAIRHFLIKANEHGYGAGDAAKTVQESDGSKTIVFEEGNWKYHDNYFGGEPYGGREVVFNQGKAVWMMVYYGRVINGDNADIYGILRQALQLMPERYPFRGPVFLQGGNEWTYTNTWSGELPSFSGNEKIYIQGELAYEASYLGGLVDQQSV